MARSAADIIVRPVKAYRAQRTAILSAPSTVENPDALASFHDMRPVPRASSSRGCLNTASAIAGASASGVGGFFKSYSRGMYIDMPLAVAEGFRAVPRMYGETVPEQEAIVDWQSGARVAGKNFVTGISGGFSDIVMLPYQGATADGVSGAAKGVGKGLLGFTCKTASGMSNAIHAERYVLIERRQQLWGSWHTLVTVSIRASGFW